MNKQKIAAGAGIAAPVLGFSCIMGAIASYPQFSWTHNALSDLGVVPGLTAPLFNFGLVFTGILAFCFSILGLFSFLGTRLAGKVGAIVFAAATVALICIGIFNEDFSPTHYLVSVAFFSLAPIGLFVLTYAMWLDRKRGLAAFTVAVGVAAALPWILQFTLHYVPKVAIPEAISALAVGVWVVVICIKILTAKSTRA